MPDKYQEIIITKQPIELCKLLKIANLVSGGGEAKIVITQGYVLLNGEVEFQKRKKIKSGDIIQFNGETLSVVYQAQDKTISTTNTIKKSNKSLVTSALHPQQKPQSKPKRKAINF